MVNRCTPNQLLPLTVRSSCSDNSVYLISIWKNSSELMGAQQLLKMQFQANPFPVIGAISEGNPKSYLGLGKRTKVFKIGEVVKFGAEWKKFSK